MNYHVYREYLDFKKINRKKLPLDFWLIMLPLFGYLVSFVLAGFFEKPWIIIIGLVCVVLFFGLLFKYDKKLKSENNDNFENKEKERKALFKKLKTYKIDREERVVSLKNWLKIRIENYEKRVRATCIVFSTIIFSGVIAFCGDFLPYVFENNNRISQNVLAVIISVSCFVFVAVVVALGLYFSEYYDYKNMKLFFEDLQDILDYNLYEEKQEENKPNENEEDKPQEENNELIKDDENLETENKPKPKKCKKNIGKKITIEIVKYDYTGDLSAES